MIRKTGVAFLLLILFMNTSTAQYAALDAYKLKGFIDPATGKLSKNPDSLKKYVPILKNYIKEPLRSSTETNTTVIWDEFENNPFLKPYKPNASSTSVAVPQKSNSAGFLSSIGSFDVTNIADGLAKFLVKRTKEELNAAFFSRFYDLIKREEYKDARLLFPQTYASLNVIGSQVYNYDAYITSLKEAFQKDLETLLDNFPAVIRDGRYHAFFDAHPELKATCLSALYIGNALLKKQQPGKIIEEYKISLLDSISNRNVKAAVQTLQLFSASLKSASSTRYWMNADELEALKNDNVAFNIYLGLIYQQAEVTFENNITLKQVLKTGHDNAAELQKITAYIGDFIRQAELLNSSVENLLTIVQDKTDFGKYYAYYNNALNLVQYAVNFYKLPELQAFETTEKVQRFTEMVRTGGNIAFDISRKNYGSAILNTYTLYNFVFGGSEEEIRKVIDTAKIDTLIKKATAALKKDRDDLLQGHTELVKKFLLKYGVFISSVAQAKNSDEVASAIEASALPSGSSRIKRESRYNIALNAYVGLYAGYERIKGVDSGKLKFNSYGITAPIGITLSCGGIKSVKHPAHGGKSVSLFISVLDLGAVTAFRFSDTTTEKVPTIQLKDIISPGLFFSYGLGKVPLSLNFGYQYGPLLRTVKLDENKYDKSYSRFSLSVCVDIPLLNFHTN